LSDPIDVFTDWIDACDEANREADAAEGGRQDPDLDAEYDPDRPYADGVDDESDDESAEGDWEEIEELDDVDIGGDGGSTENTLKRDERSVSSSAKVKGKSNRKRKQKLDKKLKDLMPDNIGEIFGDAIKAFQKQAAEQQKKQQQKIDKAVTEQARMHMMTEGYSRNRKPQPKDTPDYEAAGTLNKPPRRANL